MYLRLFQGANNVLEKVLTHWSQVALECSHLGEDIIDPRDRTRMRWQLQ